ncbi:GntR family transcriptional regulator [Xylanimonas allomyrinae]|uniref:GntR family transcriptional regulator n=1 Tax=Xylanimonas allomyrinae TaxID=2509459 RepID=UPI001FED0F77|nr:winged helix-turn-helix domain-containing protein [Xylanimonas allomyrinae]
MTPPPAHRHLSAASTTRLLGIWHAGGPAYAALADALRQCVLTGSLAPNTRLPSERALAAALGVSRATTTAAYRRLRDAGFAVSRTGSGTVAVLPRPATPPAREPGGDAPAAVPAPHPDDVVDLSQATPAAPPSSTTPSRARSKRCPPTCPEAGTSRTASPPCGPRSPPGTPSAAHRPPPTRSS